MAAAAYGVVRAVPGLLGLGMAVAVAVVVYVVLVRVFGGLEASDRGRMAACAVAQSAAPAPVLSNGGLIHSLVAAPVAGQPFSAVQVTRTKRTLADGTTVSHNGHHSVARDIEGRVRVEHRLTKAQDGQPEMVLVFVTDPVAHTLTTWVTGGMGPKTASVVKLPKDRTEKPSVARPVAAESNRPQPMVTTEDLGLDSVEGQTVTVSKTTTVVPQGRSGNDAPITKTHEVWTSPDLKLVLKEQWDDPRSGERTVSLEKLSRADPDPALFRAPAGYQVKDALESLKEIEAKMEQAAQNN